MTAEAPSSCRLRTFAATTTLAQHFDPLTVDAASIAAAVGVSQAEFEAEFDTLEHYFAGVQRFPSLNEEMRRRNHGMLLMIQMEYSTMKSSYPMECARLAVGMVLETVKLEAESRQKNQPMRDRLMATLESFART
jgi:hypothetical protein